MITRMLLSAAATAALLAGTPAHAVPAYTFTTPDFALPAFSGTGLVGSVWADVLMPSALGDRTIAFAKTYMAANTPNAVFASSSVDYPQGSSNVVPDQTTTIAAFLGTDGASLSPPLGATVLARRVDGLTFGTAMRFTGYYRVDAPGSVLFNIGSDDGADIIIQGTQVAVNVPPAGGINAFTTLPSPVEVQFDNPGLYALTINWFDGEPTEAGIAFGTGADNTVIPQALLYQTPIPEPGSLLVLAFGMLALLIAGSTRMRHAVGG